MAAVCLHQNELLVIPQMRFHQDLLPECSLEVQVLPMEYLEHSVHLRTTLVKPNSLQIDHVVSELLHLEMAVSTMHLVAKKQLSQFL